jgi:NADH-quinone oxidoreductase subunit J
MIISTSGLVLISGLMVVISGNPVHSVLFIVLTFIGAAAMVLLLGAEYLARTLIVVYVGAIAILFRFVVIMLEVRVPRISDWTRLLPVGALLVLAFILELWVVRSGDLVPSLALQGPESNNWSHLVDVVPVLQIFGQVLYTKFVYYFLVAGLVLLAAMVAAIVRTMSARTQVKRQHLFEQLSRSNDLSIFLVKDQNSAS